MPPNPCLNNLTLLYWQVAYKTVKQCTWPAQDTQDFVKKLPDGTIQVQSLDEYARLILMAHKQMFIVNFLAEVDVPLPVRLLEKWKRREGGGG